MRDAAVRGGQVGGQGRLPFSTSNGKEGRKEGSCMKNKPAGQAGTTDISPASSRCVPASIVRQQCLQLSWHLAACVIRNHRHSTAADIRFNVGLPHSALPTPTHKPHRPPQSREIPKSSSPTSRPQHHDLQQSTNDSRLHHFADASTRSLRVVRALFSNPPPTTTSSHQPSRCRTTRARRTSARPPFVPPNPMPPPLDKTDPSLQKVHKIRITLTSRKVASLEKVCSELIERYVRRCHRAPPNS